MVGILSIVVNLFFVTKYDKLFYHWSVI